MAMTAPHLAWPVRITGNTLATTVQGSAADLESQARLLLNTRPRERVALLQAAADYGIASQVGTRDIDLEPIRAAISRWIPGGDRVQIALDPDTDDDTIIVQVQL
jgi:hypothetical protein